MQKRKKFFKCLILALRLSTKLLHYSFCNILFMKLINLWLKINPNQNYYKKCKNMYLQQIMPHKRLHSQSQKQKQHKAAQNMSKANKKYTQTTPLTSWCLHHQLRPYPTPHTNAPLPTSRRQTSTGP